MFFLWNCGRMVDVYQDRTRGAFSSQACAIPQFPLWLKAPGCWCKSRAVLVDAQALAIGGFAFMPSGHYPHKNRTEHIFFACEVCGKEIELTPSQVKKRRVRFCSTACFSLWRKHAGRKKPKKAKRTHIAKVKCAACGRGFYVYPSQVKQRNYCSGECRNIHPSIEVICDSCGKPFMRFPCKLGTKNYCSRNCAIQARYITGVDWNDPVSVQSYNRKYHQAHRDEALAQSARWATEHPEKTREIKNKYRKNHPEQSSHAARIRRSRKANLNADFTKSDWRHCLDYWHDRCAICGRPRGLWHTLAADHWIPVASAIPGNPGTVPWNILPLCQGIDGCNNSKSDSDPVKWLMKKLGDRKGKLKLKEITDYFELTRTWR